MANPDLAFGALMKKPRGSVQTERRQRSLDKSNEERRIMNQARKRDNGCRFPKCDCKKLKLTVEVCHETHRAMGGNPALDRTTVESLISLCIPKHEAWDRSEIAIVPVDRALGFNGPAAFYASVNGQLVHLATEKRYFVSGTRSEK